MGAKEDTAVLLESILLTYFNITVIEWENMSKFYGQYKVHKPKFYNIESGTNTDADFHFSFKGDCFHIIENFDITNPS